MKSLHSFSWLILATALLIVTGCSTSHPTTTAGPVVDNTAFAPPVGLTAALTNRNNILLHWTNQATVDGGVWVEFTTPGSEFVKLDVFMADNKSPSFLHPQLAPATTYVYHLLPFFGQATGPVEITTGTAPSNDVPALEEGPIPSTNNAAIKSPTYSIRALSSFAQAAPTNLTATLSSPTSVDLHWEDRASNEDGYLVEIGSSAEGTFFVCALLPPDTTSFRKMGLPSATRCYFRVRAFFNGPPTEPVSVMTPQFDPQTSPITP